MALTPENAEKLAEAIHDFNPNLMVKINPGKNEVTATIDRLKIEPNDLQILAILTKGRQVDFEVLGSKIRMIIY